MLPLIPIITGLISSFKDSPVGQAKTGMSQNVGELVTNKTNLSAMTIVGFTINHLTGNPDSTPAWIMLGICLLAITLRDTANKILVELMKRNDE
ncbi:MAG: hypothetical protein ABUJ92_00050 [Desulfobacterales bacterium]